MQFLLTLVVSGETTGKKEMSLEAGSLGTGYFDKRSDASANPLAPERWAAWVWRGGHGLLMNTQLSAFSLSAGTQSLQRVAAGVEEGFSLRGFANQEEFESFVKWTVCSIAPGALDVRERQALHKVMSGGSWYACPFGYQVSMPGAGGSHGSGSVFGGLLQPPVVFRKVFRGCLGS